MLEDGEIDEAIAHYEGAMLRTTTYAVAYHNLGIASSARGEHRTSRASRAAHRRRRPRAASLSACEVFDDRFGAVISSRYSKSCGNVIFSSAVCSLDRFAVFAFVAHVTAGFDAVARLADERDGKAFAGHLVVDAHAAGLRISIECAGLFASKIVNGEVVRGSTISIEPDDEHVLGGKELVTAFVAARDLVEDACATKRFRIFRSVASEARVSVRLPRV